jgi:hypothetical protein
MSEAPLLPSLSQGSPLTLTKGQREDLWSSFRLPEVANEFPRPLDSSPKCLPIRHLQGSRVPMQTEPPKPPGTFACTLCASHAVCITALPFQMCISALRDCPPGLWSLQTHYHMPICNIFHVNGIL